MFEMNDYELGQVTGGGHHYESHSSASGISVADLGATESHSFSTSDINARGATSSAWNDSVAIGINPASSSSSDSGSGTK
ncbi:MAG: hypothetical protein NVS2B12_35780 [Ktedonobacteraceae bacterium]